MGTGLLLVVLAVGWVFLLLYTFRHPAPKLRQLLAFVGLLVVSGLLAYVFLIRVLHFDPNPGRLKIANLITDSKFIDLTQIVPGAYGLDYIRRIDTDGVEEKNKEEWLVFYQYDIKTFDKGARQGPYGAAIYDYNDCRPPAILSYELVAASYDYLGQDAVSVTVEKIISYADPVSGGRDYPEVIIVGMTRGAATDINIFRKTGVELTCAQWQQWRAAHPTEVFPNSIDYKNIGSFRGNYRVARDGATITVVDRSPFERSQITIKRQYRPDKGAYFRAGTQELLPPVEVSLDFGPGQPDQVPQVYYPEKAVLAFYKNLTQDEGQLEKAKGYLSPDAQAIFDIKTDQFGLAMPRQDVARVLVWEMRYYPDIAAEQQRLSREVTVTVVGVDKDGNMDVAHPCEVTWGIIGLDNASALPYGCEWRLDWYSSHCSTGR